MNVLYVDEIKAIVKIQDVFKKYGFEVNRAGFTRCPFHKEKTASLKAYSNGEKFKCFGCNAGGSVIDFVALFFNIPFSSAVSKINEDFSLGLPIGERMTIREKYNMRKKIEERQIQLKKEQKEKAKKEQQYWDLWSEWIYLDKLKREYKPKDIEEEFHPLYAAALHRIEYLNCLMDALL